MFSFKNSLTCLGISLPGTPLPGGHPPGLLSGHPGGPPAGLLAGPPAVNQNESPRQLSGHS